MIAVVALLLTGLLRQFGQIGPRGQLLDRLALMPQWKFFGQIEIETKERLFDDIHLVARSESGDWEDVLRWGERPVLSAIWNPGGLSRFAIAEQVFALADGAKQGRIEELTSLAYLTTLRHCLDHMPVGQSEAIQFAVLTTRGRGQQVPQVVFLSAWHCP